VNVADPDAPVLSVAVTVAGPRSPGPTCPHRRGDS
jgi:hypothetical protein